jgi:hypothetical protein
MDHPTVSHDLASRDFWLFPKLKRNSLKTQRFADIHDIPALRDVTKRYFEKYFQGCFRQWHHRPMKCIVSQGQYFDGNSSR